MKHKPLHDLHAGTHSVSQLIRSRPQQLLWVGVLAQKHRDLVKKAKQHGILVKTLTQAQMDEQEGHTQHQGICAQAQWLTPSVGLFDLVKQRGDDLWVVILDGVQDPHNLGACCRSACAMGVDAIILPERRACGITPTVSKVATGALSFLPIYTVTNVAQTMKKLHKLGVWCIGTSEHAEKTIAQVDARGPLAVVCGNEQNGVRALTLSHCDQVVKIDLPGPIKSLNVSVALGVTLYACAQQRAT